MKNSGKLLAIDYGKVNVGLAISDNLQILSIAKTVLKKNDELLTKLHLFSKQENITAGIIVGKPHTNNKDLDIDQFCQALSKKLNLPVITFNEDFSTIDAFTKMEEIKLSPKEQQVLKDAFAAQIILENFLNSRSNSLP